MRQVLHAWIVVAVTVMSAGAAGAETQGAPVSAEPAAAAPAAQPPAPEAPKTPEDKLRAQLENTSWPVQLTQAGEAGAKPKKDVISFTRRQVSSEFMSKAGYPASNYSLTIGDDGRGVWETMQTKEGEGVAFWRGEFDGTTMRGVLSKHPVEGAVEDYNFAGQIDGGQAITIPERADAPSQAAAPVQAPKPAAPAAVPAQQDAPKKKRKWF
jgi:hypothetical protein